MYTSSIKLHFLFFVIIIAILIIPAHSEVISDSPVMYQASTYAMVESGNYSEVITVDEMKSFGNFGVGGFKDLDGELTQINGDIYQIKHDGSVLKPEGDTGICFANTITFDPEYLINLNETMNEDTLLANIHDSFPDENVIYAFRIDGEFPEITVRSVPPQEEPYPSLSEVIEDQSVFHLQNISGTVSGFWFPEWMQGVNYAGFHTHFITDARDAGGHVLDMTTENASVSIQPIYTFTMILPDKKED